MPASSTPPSTTDAEILAIRPPVAGDPIQFVTPDGQLTERGRAYGVDVESTQGLYRDMFLARRLDTEALALQRQGELGLWLMSLGQEAAQVGSIRALRETDYVFPSYREHAAALARGIGPADLLRQWRGVSHAGWDPRPYRFHFYSLVLGTQTLHATGYAMGVQRDGTDEIVMTYFGNGASSEGDVSEALNWASVMTAPVLFFCQNNHWAISTPDSQQSRTRLAQRAAAFGLQSYLVDGNDVLAVHAVTTTASARVRDGHGPAFVEADTYRMAGHSTSDDPTKYRDAAELDLWRSRDPLHRVRKLLEDSGVDQVFFKDLDSEAEDLGEATRQACHSLPDPDMAEFFETVYAAPHPLMERQAAEYAAYRASWAEGELP
jgi:2-oxoisovalerate dehydrogenase E1 component alpha subunit